MINMKHGNNHKQGGRPQHVLAASMKLQVRENAESSKDMAAKTELMELASRKKRPTKGK